MICLGYRPDHKHLFGPLGMYEKEILSENHYQTKYKSHLTYICKPFLAIKSPFKNVKIWGYVVYDSYNFFLLLIPIELHIRLFTL